MSSKLIRWGGRAAVLGGILFAAVFVLINWMIYGLKQGLGPICGERI